MKKETTLFTTHDGFAYTGQEIKLYYVNLKTMKATSILGTNYWLAEEAKKWVPLPNTKNVWFKSKSKAEKFVIDNTPVLTLAEVKNSKSYLRLKRLTRRKVGNVWTVKP